MEKLISAEEASKLVSGTEERKQELVKMLNKEISSNAEAGRRWAHFPSGISEYEKQLLSDWLVIKGFTVKDTHPAINW